MQYHNRLKIQQRAIRGYLRGRVTKADGTIGLVDVVPNQRRSRAPIEAVEIFKVIKK